MPIFIRSCRTRWKPSLRGVAFTPVAVVAALSIWPLAPARAQARGDHNAANLERTVDASIRPGDDFFGYANGSWLKATEIPVGKER